MGRPRALLTGCSGFTGHYVAREMEQRGYEIFGLSVHEQENDPNLRQVDLLDRIALANAVADIAPDVVIHLAAISFVAHGDVEEIYRVNVVGTRNLLEALAESSKRPEVVVLASSANIYGNAEVEPITEDTVPAPVNDYAVSKLAMEYMARLWMDKLPIIITRPFNYTGFGQSERFLIPKIVDHFASGADEIELGNTDVYRDFSDVRDVAAAYANIVARKCVGQTLNICSGIAFSLGQILLEMERISGRKIRVRVNPAFVRMNEVKRLRGSLSRLRGEIKYTARPMDETLKWMYGSKKTQ